MILLADQISCWTAGGAEEDVHQVGRVSDLRGGAGQHDAPGAHHRGVVGEFEPEADVLLHHQNSDSSAEHGAHALPDCAETRRI